MKKKIIVSSIVYFGLCVLVFNACCKKKCNDPTNPECENYDPCSKALKASFEIGEKCGGFEIESDTIAPFYPVYFKVTCEADSFIWYIGSEVIREKSFVRKAFPKWTKIPVTLVVKKNKLIASCINDVLIDTLVRTFYTMDYYDDYSTSTDTGMAKDASYRPIEGKYYGYYKSDPSKKCTISYNNMYVVTQQDVLTTCDFWDNFPIIGLGYKNQKFQYPYIRRLTNDITTLQATCFEFNTSVPNWYDTLLPNSLKFIHATELKGVGWLDVKDHNKITIGVKYIFNENQKPPNLTKIDTFWGSRVY